MRKLFEHPLMIVLLTVIAGIFCFSLYVSGARHKNSTETLNSLEESVARQQARVQELEEQATLSSDPFVQEKIQRDERLQGKPGEIVLQLPNLAVPSPTPEPTPKKLTPWDEWKEVLFRRF